MTDRRGSPVVVRVGLLLAALLLAGSVFTWWMYQQRPLLVLGNVPDVYPRRSETLSANVTGSLDRRVDEARYRLNDGPWLAVPRGTPRADPPLFTIELAADLLRVGENELQLEARAPLHPDASQRVTFAYEPAPIALPLLVDWEERALEAQDGVWETVLLDGEWRVRPVPGLEGYDRILLVSGAFAGGRRVETDAIFRYAEQDAWPEQIFGVLTLWAGHPDDWTVLPRRGYRFAMACWWSKPGGAGSEISEYRPGREASFVNTYRNLPLEPGRKHHVVAEVVPEVDGAGRHVRWTQRVKWWLDGQTEPEHWQVLSDDEGSTLGEGEWSVALLVYRSQVDFGPVRVTALPSEPARDR